MRTASQLFPLASTFAGTPCTEGEVAFEGDVGTQDPFFTTVIVVPANLSPEYKAAEAAFRKSRDPRERLERLREMLRAIPKHKGTEHLQADIKARIKDLGEELEGARKGGGHGSPALVIRPEGAAQIALIGPPNAGRSSLHARLTGSGARVATYPFTTSTPTQA